MNRRVLVWPVVRTIYRIGFDDGRADAITDVTNIMMNRLAETTSAGERQTIRDVVTDILRG